MDRSDIEADPRFTYPVLQLIQMMVVAGLVVAGGWVVWPRIEGVFYANPYLNGFILAVFVFGVIACYWQVYQLARSVRWIEGFAANRPGHENIAAPPLLASLATLLRSRGSRTQISSTSSRSILDSIATRIDEARDITRYIVNLLIFLGLLGTFFGLATTVPAVVETIQSLEPREGETSVEIFSRLMGGLEKQLGGMGTAFASSLLGLAGSLVVGLLELFATHGQNRFYRELEDWLSTITRVGLSSGDGEAGGLDQGAVGAVLDQMMLQMEGLQRLFIQSDEARSHTDERLSGLATSLDKVASELEKGGGTGGPGPSVDPALMARIADGQEQLVAALQHQASSEHVDAESRMRLRSIDVQLLRILEEISAGRLESFSDLRGDLSALTEAIKSLNSDTENRQG